MPVYLSKDHNYVLRNYPLRIIYLASFHVNCRASNGSSCHAVRRLNIMTIVQVKDCIELFRLLDSAGAWQEVTLNTNPDRVCA